MKILLILTIGFVLMASASQVLFAGEGHDHEETMQSHSQTSGHAEDEDHEHDEHTETLSTEISKEHAASSGVTIGIAKPGTIARTQRAYGRVVIPPGNISHIRARYTGLIKEVRVDVGDIVDAGDLLAEVESNDSLKSYAILSPINGKVTQRHANAGELAGDQVLFSVTDSTALWVEYRIFESQLAEVEKGQKTTVASESQSAVTEIRSMVPSLDEHPFVVAIAALNNSKNSWSPGMFVTGDIEVENFDTELVIENKALQTLDGRQGVFIQSGDHYEFRPLVLGERDSTFTEVLSGLRAGESYVNKMSYLIKADIEKAGAAHEH